MTNRDSVDAETTDALRVLAKVVILLMVGEPVAVAPRVRAYVTNCANVGDPVTLALSIR